MGTHLWVDRVYEGDETRPRARDLGCVPVVPPWRTRVKPWAWDRELYRRWNGVERLCRLKRCRRIATRYEKLDALFLGFMACALIFDARL